MKKRMIALLLAMGLLLAGCASKDDTVTRTETAASEEEGTENEAAEEKRNEEVLSASRDVFAMDTWMTITCYGERCEEAIQAAVDEIERLDTLLSAENPEGEIGKINANGAGTLNEDARTIVEKALEISEKTDGLFDITIYPIMQLWGFAGGGTITEFCVPEPEEIGNALTAVGSKQVTFQANSGEIALATGQGIDLGGIAKGYTSDRLMEIFREHDLVCGIVSLGGNVQTYGTKPNGSMWRCGIREPLPEDDSDSIMGILEIADEAVITSGAYERYFAVDEETGAVTGAADYSNITEAIGTIYHHIIDPTTGYPGDAGIISATIVSESGILADGLSTACYLMGVEKAAEYWKKTEDAFGFILLTADHSVYITEDLADRFTTDYPVTVITKE